MRFPHAVDPMTEDPRDREDREAEQQRFEDEQALLAVMRFNPFLAAKDVVGVYAGDQWTIVGDMAAAFAADYGWPAVFRVLAAAIHAYGDATHVRR
jgi:hypothetical protein